MFTWYRLENSNTLDFSPYGSYLYQGVYQIRYKLSQAVAYQSVQSVTLHLTSYGNTGPHYLNLALWDFTLEDWVPVEMTDWGDFEISDPARFVGSGGDIRLQIDNPNQISVDLERADFTLVVEQ